MKTLIVYYSKSNVTKRVAHELKKRLECDIEEIQETKKRSGFFGWLMSGREAFMKKAAKISDLKYNPEDYDLVLIGGPIWAWDVCSPVRKYCELTTGKIQNTGFFCTMGSSGNDKAFATMQQILKKQPLSTLVLTTKEAVKQKWNSKIELFIDAIKVKL